MGHHEVIREQVTIGKQGRLVIPARIREALSIQDGTRITLRVTDGELQIRTVEASIAKARSILGITGPPPPGSPTAADLIRADREEDLALDEAKWKRISRDQGL